MAYTQAPSLTREEIESFLKEAKTARFCSLNDDGTIHAAPVWFKYENGNIIVSTPAKSRKARNAKRNKNVTILVDVEAWPQRGVLIYGTAKLDYDNLIPTATSICEKYMPKEEADKWAEKWVSLTNPSTIVIVKPERMASFDYAKDEAFQIAAQG